MPRAASIPKPRPRRLAHIMWIAATIATLVSAFAGVASGFWHYELRRWSGDGFACQFIKISGGRIDAGYTSIFRVTDTGPQQTLEYQPDIPWQRRWSGLASAPIISHEPYGPDMAWDWTIVFPMWIPMSACGLTIALPALWRWRRTCRTTRGRCAACGYSLAGLTGDLCPECGRGLPPSSVAV